jgi:hypothetical protein
MVPSIVSMLSHLAATGSLRQIIAVHADRTQGSTSSSPSSSMPPAHVGTGHFAAGRARL